MKDKVEVAQRSRQDTEHLNQVLRGEKDELLDQKREMFNVGYHKPSFTINPVLTMFHSAAYLHIPE